MSLRPDFWYITSQKDMDVPAASSYGGFQLVYSFVDLHGSRSLHSPPVLETDIIRDEEFSGLQEGRRERGRPDGEQGYNRVR